MQDKALQEEVKLAPAVEEPVKEKEEEPTKEKFVGGEAPAVAAAGLADHGSKTASQLASGQPRPKRQTYNVRHATMRYTAKQAKTRLVKPAMAFCS